MANLETATLAAGCFWCVEAVFDDLKGVEDVVSGYSGGHTENPTYQEVCSETTGHAEVAQIKFDPDELSFADLLPSISRSMIRHSSTGKATISARHTGRRSFITPMNRSASPRK